MSKVAEKNEKKKSSFFGRVLSIFKSKRVRLTFYFIFIIFATLSMFFIDTLNTVREAYMPFLTDNFLSDFFVSLGVGRYDVTASSWLLFGCIMSLVLTILIGNIIAPKFVEKKVEKNRELFKSEKAIKILYTIVFYFFLVLIAGVIVLAFYFAGAFGAYYNANTVETSPFISLITMLGIFLAFLFSLIIAAFIVYLLIKLILVILDRLFSSKKKKAVVAENVAQPAVAETAAAEQPAEEIIVAAAPKKTAEKEVKVAPITLSDDTATRKVVVRSFEGKMRQTKRENVEYYNEIKNHFLSYKRVNSRTSWNCDSFNIGRKKAAKIAFRGQTMVMYLALNPAEYAGTKYYPRDLSNKKKYADTPMMIKVKSERGVKFAKELIDVICRDLEVKKEFVPTKYTFARMSDKKLIENGFAKETFVKI